MLTWLMIAAVAIAGALQNGADTVGAIQVCQPPAAQAAGPALRDYVACLYFTPETGDTIRRCPAGLELREPYRGRPEVEGLYFVASNEIEVRGVNIGAMLHEEAHCLFEARARQNPLWAQEIGRRWQEFAVRREGSDLTATEIFAQTIELTHCRVDHPLFAGICRTAPFQPPEAQIDVP